MTAKITLCSEDKLIKAEITRDKKGFKNSTILAQDHKEFLALFAIINL